MSKECKKNKYLNIILDDRVISRGTFANFLNNTDREGVHKIIILKIETFKYFKLHIIN